jgi:hypothetical protein
LDGLIADLQRRPMDLIGRFQLWREMLRLLIVDSDGLTDHTPGLMYIFRLLKQEFVLQNAIDPLCQCILITAPRPEKS